MHQAQFSAHVLATIAYLHTAKGHRELRSMMLGRGYSYERAIAEIAIYVMQRGRKEAAYEDVWAVTDEVVCAELEGVAV